MIYTSYFAQLKKIEDANGLPVSIAKWPPKWYTGASYSLLKPNGSLVKAYKNHLLDEKEFEADFLDDLGDLDAERILYDLQAMSDFQDVYLLCYEKPSDFCHRHIVSEWLRKNGVECQEKIW